MLTYDDHIAGLRLTFPEGWRLRTDDLMGPFTCVALLPDPASDLSNPEVRRARAEERSLWVEASGGALTDIDEDEDDEDDPDSTTFVMLGTWDDPEDHHFSPTDPLEAADWVATTFGAYFDAFPQQPLTPQEEVRQSFELAGRPAASVSYTFPAYRHGEEAGHLRSVAIQLADGRVCFGLGLAKAEPDWPLIDRILEDLRPLA